MQSIGELAKEFRKARGWSYTRMAQEVAKHGDNNVSRQAITQLEAAGARKPHYIAALAKVMGTTTDHLLSGAEPTQESEPWVAELAGMLAEVPPEDRAGMLAHFRWYIKNFGSDSQKTQRPVNLSFKPLPIANPKRKSG